MRYSGDPRWINVRFKAPCKKCGKTINRDERAYYYPNGRELFCSADACGGECERDFQSHKQDEDFLGRNL